MPMTTNVCAKHGHAHADDDCPECVRESWERDLELSRKFFKTHEARCLSEMIDQYDIDIEEVYQHFKVRLMSDLGLAPGSKR